MDNIESLPEQQQQQREARTAVTEVQSSFSHLNPIRIKNNTNGNILPMENRKVENRIQYNGNDSSSTSSSADDMKHEHYADKGHFKHGWKNVYHKEEWGEANKYHDIWRLNT
ncbi:hypothetical protein BLA29_007896 [Euroglyphus maynei]|uniref:Uncharacterized protein n=1 Tax=Euroglyphus maynei TaxID=6958 RepID=A0A1Y3BLL9_EURMA|nr:hypothetical protein BLA29_007896 [Euroglyphus maynei]